MRITSDMPIADTELELLPKNWYDLPDSELEVLFDKLRGQQVLNASKPARARSTTPKEPAKPKIKGFIIKEPANDVNGQG